MISPAPLLPLISDIQQHVSALETLAAAITAGLHAGMVDADHLYTLVTTQARAINTQLERLTAEKCAEDDL
jgi:hypothetical protein